MPIIWRYIYKQFFKVFILTTVSFIFILLITKLKDIARFISLCPEPKYVFAFIFNLFPYILPIALPISAILSAILLFQRMSRTHELTALRCAGYSLFSVVYPVLAVSLLFSLVNFFIVSEMTSYSQVFSRRLINQLITTNPLFLLEHKNKLKKKDVFIDMSIQERGRSARNLVVITPDRSGSRLNLLAIDQLDINEGRLCAPNINVVSIVEKETPTSASNHLLIENEKNVKALASDLNQILHHTFLNLQPHHLTMSYLLITLENKKNELKHILSKKRHSMKEETRLKYDISDLNAEVMRRLSIGLSVFTFTLIGISYSIEIGRSRKRKNLIMMSSLSIFGLLCFFTGKIFHGHVWIATLIYLTPHALSIFLSSANLSKTMRGIE